MELTNIDVQSQVYIDANTGVLILIQVHHQRRGVYLDDINGAVWLRVPPARVKLMMPIQVYIRYQYRCIDTNTGTSSTSRYLPGRH